MYAESEQQDQTFDNVIKKNFIVIFLLLATMKIKMNSYLENIEFYWFDNKKQEIEEQI